MKVTFYIDGFNFYFGLKRTMKADSQWAKFYWIDMVKLCSSFLGEGQELEKVIYFTASPLNPQKSSRQSAFLNANKLLNGEKFEVVRGKYIEKQITCPYCKGSISRPEEKKTDVNICLRMIEDCALGRTDSVSLVSADTDLIPALDMINRLYAEKKVKVYFPPSNYSSDIRDYLAKRKSRPVLMLKNARRFLDSIMDFEVTDGVKIYHIPSEWKKHFE